jgi:integrase
MTLRRDPTTKNYSADIRDRSFGRIHLSLKSDKKSVATERYAALRALIREGDPTLVNDIRRRRLNIEAVTRMHIERRPFAELRSATAWPTVGAARDAYLAWIEEHPRRSAKTLFTVRSEIKSAVDFFDARTPLTQITHDRVRDFRRALEARGLKPTTVRLHLSRLGALFRWCQRQETRDAAQARRPATTLYSPVDPEAIPDRAAGRVRFLSQDEAERLVAATPDALQLAVALGLLAGLRAGEVLSLRPPPHDIDLTLGLILVQPKEGWRPKSKASQREVPIADALRPILDRHLASYASDRWLFPSRALGGRGAGHANAISADTLQLEFRRIVTAAGMVAGRDDPLGVTFHTLRHTFASWLTMGGVDLFTGARLMGHASTKEMETVYGHLAPEHRKRAVGLLNDQLASAFKPYGVAGGVSA